MLNCIFPTAIGFLLLLRDTMTTATLIKKTFSWAGLQCQRFSQLWSRWETWQRAGRHSAGEGAESSMSRPRAAETIVCHTRHSLNI